MANKMLSITVQGKRCKWTFEFMGDPKYLEEWRADDLHIEEVCNIIPEWVQPQDSSSRGASCKTHSTSKIHGARNE